MEDLERLGTRSPFSEAKLMTETGFPGPSHLLKVAFAFGIFLLTACPAAAQRVNLAKYQQVTASVANSTYVADFAVDGIASNFHSWRTGNNPGPHWLEVTYPQPVTLASAHLYSGLLNATTVQVWQNFRFQYHNGSTWIDIPGSTVSGNTSPEVNVLFTNPVTATRFRLLGSDTSNRTVRQLALFPPNPDGGGIEQGFPIGTDVTLNLAYQRPTLASSIYNPGTPPINFPRQAVDGYVDDASRWLCTAASGETLEIDLLDIQTVGSAHLYSGFGNGNALADFSLDWWDGSTWQTVPGATITGNTQQARNLLFSSPVTTAKIRLRITTASNARLRELLVFPPRSGGYPLGQDVTIGPPPTAKWDDFNDATHRIRITSPDRRLGLVSGSAVFTNNAAGADAVNWQLLLNYRDGSYRIRHVKTGLCLTLASLSKAANTLVIGETYTALPHQDWFLDFTSPTQFRIRNAYSGLAIQPLNATETLGTPLSVATPNGSNLQLWDTVRQHHHPKKGIAATNNQPVPAFENPADTWLSHLYIHYPHSSWSYSWGRQNSNAFPYMGTHHVFNPMQWGNYNFSHGGAGPLDIIRRDLMSNPKPASLMGFNEPDGAEQANMTVAAAILRWPRLQAMDAPLISPGPVNAPIPWIDDFYEQANLHGYRVDYTSVHWYKAPSAESLITNLEQIYNKYGRPIWLTEFSAVRWSGTATWTHADNYNFLAEFLWRAEALPYLQRYSLFNFRESATGPNQSANDPPEAPRSNALRADGSLTPFGELYGGWDGVTSVVNHKAYFLHNRQRYRRVRNPSSTDTLASIAPDADTGADQWFLVPGTTANTLRISSTHDGKRIRFFNGTYVGLAAATNEQPQTEWRVAANQYGWYYIEHPGSNQRLRIDANGVLQMGPITSTGDDYKWRFAATSEPEPVAIPAAPTDLTSQATASQITVTWQASVGAVRYTVQRAPNLAGPWTNVATALTATEWADTGLPHSTTYHYRISATNNLGTSAPSSTLTTTTEPEPLLAPATPTGLAATYVSSEIHLTWSPAARAASYTIHRTTNPGGPWQIIATGLAATHWEDSAIAYTTTYSYTVTAINDIGSSDPSVAASVTSPHTNTTFTSWATTWLAHLPLADRQPGADPDADNLANLLEYLFLTDPDAAGGNPFQAQTAADGTLTLTFPWNWRATDYTWQLRHGPDLTSPTTWPVIDPGTVEAIREGNIDRLRVTPAMAHPTRGFFILEIVAP